MNRQATRETARGQVRRSQKARATQHTQTRTKGEVLYASAERADFKELMPGVSMAVLWGDHDTGPHGTFTRFEPGFDAGMHSHTNNVWVVVLKGAYLYRDDSGEKRVGPGEFMRIPGGLKHWSGGDADAGALFYQEGSGKFDLIPSE